MKTGETFICWSSPRGYSWDLLYLQNIFTAQNSKTWGSKIQLYQKHSSATVKIWCGESFLKKKHGSRCHRNKFWLWSWTQGMKMQIGCWAWTITKRREHNDSKDDVFRNSAGRRPFVMDNSVCCNKKCLGQVWLKKIKSPEILSLSQVQH